MMTKNQKHEKLDKFRKEVALPTARAAAIKGLIEKGSYDEADELKIAILLKKDSFIKGCEQAYKELLAHLMSKPEWRENALDFYRRWRG